MATTQFLSQQRGQRAIYYPPDYSITANRCKTCLRVFISQRHRARCLACTNRFRRAYLRLRQARYRRAQ